MIKYDDIYIWSSSDNFIKSLRYNNILSDTSQINKDFKIPQIIIDNIHENNYNDKIAFINIDNYINIKWINLFKFINFNNKDIIQISHSNNSHISKFTCLDCILINLKNIQNLTDIHLYKIYNIQLKIFNNVSKKFYVKNNFDIFFIKQNLLINKKNSIFNTKQIKIGRAHV